MMAHRVLANEQKTVLLFNLLSLELGKV